MSCFSVVVSFTVICFFFFFIFRPPPSSPLFPYTTLFRSRPAEIAVDYRLLLRDGRWRAYDVLVDGVSFVATRSEEHTSELQSRGHLVCRLLLEKKKKKKIKNSLRQTQE